jgi:hypothetical protein
VNAGREDFHARFTEWQAPSLAVAIEQQKRDGQRAILAIEVERRLETSFGRKSSSLDKIDYLSL